MYPSTTNGYYPPASPATAPPPPPGFLAPGTMPPPPPPGFLAPGTMLPPPPPGFSAGVQIQYYPPGAMAFQVQPRRPVPWSSGLCDCTNDCGNCCMTCFCPCVTFGRIAEIVDKGSSSCGASGAIYAVLEYLTCCHWIYSCVYRSKLRGQYSIAESPYNDCLVHCCCEPCALCQEYRELKNRGFDMKIGWHANLQTAQGVTLPPAMHGGMSR